MSEQDSKAKEDELLWMRFCSLVVAGSNGNGRDLGELRIVFKTKKGDVQTPNNAEIRIYNVSEATISQMKKEFTQVILQAGYQSNKGIIFSGNICGTRTGKDNGTDTWLEIIAADSDRAYNFSTVNATLAAGSTPLDRINICKRSFSDKGASVGHIPEIAGESLPRGKVMYGMARKFMRDEVSTHNLSWSFQDGKLQVIKNNGYLPGEAVVLTHETGLIGTPEQTNEGIKVRSLLNPKLRVGGRIKIDNKSVQQAKTDLKIGAMRPPKMDSDGFYRILNIEFCGDTRGNDWYADMICIGIDDTSRKPLDTL